MLKFLANRRVSLLITESELFNITGSGDPDKQARKKGQSMQKQQKRNKRG